MEIKTLEPLPCSYYITAGLQDNHTKTQAVFTLAYIQYLEKSGIVEPKEIQQSLTSLALFAPFSNVERKTPLDFLSVKGTSYHLHTPEELEQYKSALYAVAKEPQSLSALFSKTDKHLSVCHICKYSAGYTNSEYQKELSLARAVLKDSSSFSILAAYSLEDMQKIFLSWTELFELLPKIRKPVAFPALFCVMQSICMNVSAYFDGFFEADYLSVASDFKKILGEYHIRKNTCMELEDYDRIVFHAILELIMTVSPCEDIQATCDELLNRTSYVPPFCADDVPSVILPNAKKKERTKRKVTSTTPVYRPVSYADRELDAFLESEMVADTPLLGIETSDTLGNHLEYTLEDNIEDTNMEVEEIHISSTDILSSDGTVISSPEKAALPYDDTIMDDLSAFFDDTEVADDIDDDYENISDVSEPEPEPSTQEPVEQKEDTTLNDEFSPISPAEPFHLSLDIPQIVEEEIKVFTMLINKDDFQPLNSLLNTYKYAVFAPVWYLKDVYILVYCKERYYMTSLKNENMANILKKRDICKVSPFAQALYGYSCKEHILVRNVYPVVDMTRLYDIPFVSYQNIAELLHICNENYGICLEEDVAAALLPQRALLCEAHGYSFFRDRFIKVIKKDCLAFTYTDTYDITMTPFSYKQEDFVSPGSILEITFPKETYTAEQYQGLQTLLLLHLTDKGMFRQMDLSLLSQTTHQLSFFIGRGCQRYLYTYIPSLLFDLGREKDMRNLHFDVKQLA